MAKKSVTLRGRKWERKNSLWIIWSLFACAGIGFVKIGTKVKEKKWIIEGIIWLLVLWGGMFLPSVIGEGTAAEIVTELWCLCYIGSILHSFIVKKKYLQKWDVILSEKEKEFEKERIRRNSEIENEKIKVQKEAEMNRTKLLKEYEETKESNDQLSRRLEEQNQKEVETVISDKKKTATTEDDSIIVEESSDNISGNENTKKSMYSQQTDGDTEKQGEKENNSGTSSFIGEIIAAAIFIAILIYVNPFGIGEIENAEMAEMNCGRDLVNNVFIVTPKENQVNIKAIDGKDGMVVVRIEIEDEDLLKYCIYGDDVEEIYYGYVPTSTGSSHYYYWGKSEKQVKESMGW